MTHEKKLKAVIDKICELLKGSELDPMALKEGCEVWCSVESGTVVSVNKCFNTCTVYFTSDHSVHDMPTKNLRSFGSPIREAEVLAALIKRVACVEVTENYMMFEHDNIGRIMPWIKGLPLSSQSPEVINFLFNVLNCE